MADYTLDLPDGTKVHVTKKRGMKNLRIRIKPNGQVHVSAPWLTPKNVISHFIATHEGWIKKNRTSKKTLYQNGTHLANDIRLHITTGNPRNYSRLHSNELEIRLKSRDSSDPEAQLYVEKSIIKALTTLAEHRLLPLLNELSVKHQIPFNQAYVKRMTSRWGSCDQSKNIILNIYLVQVPEPLQKYVMLHELMHTRHMNHSNQFWSDMEEILPSTKTLRKLLKLHKPHIVVKA